MNPFLESGIHIVGGGLAGCEAAWQALKAGHKVNLYEIKKIKKSPAHHSEQLAELVCSNSLKSLSQDSAAGQLKSEMQKFGSLIIEAALHASVPAGQALAVNREIFSSYIEDKLKSQPLFKRIDIEVSELPSPEEMKSNHSCWIVATGPLTSEPLTNFIKKNYSPDSLAFYDAIAPIIDADTINHKFAFTQDRYGESGLGDYLNLALNKEEYDAFIKAVVEAEYMPLHDFESTKYFEACLPIEVMAERGHHTLRFGPMKPVGITDPRTGRYPYAAVQLRKENIDATMYSMVGFQTKMKWPEQKRVFSMLPGLEEAEFIRYGSVHRNTYLHSPKLLREDLSFRTNPYLFLAGQITGVEGYTESAAIGLLAGRFAAAKLDNNLFVAPPSQTVIGSLLNYVLKGNLGPYQPMNANLGLLPPVKPSENSKKLSKKDKKAKQCQNAMLSFNAYFAEELNSVAEDLSEELRLP